MTNAEPPQGRPRGLRTGRLEGFSDGVFAIAATLLVLDVAVPASSGGHLLRAVADLWPSYLAYLVSFSTIGAVWLGHNAITDYLERADIGLVRLNLLLLLFVAFLPFPTKLLADYVGEVQPERVAATIYGVTLLMTSSLLWIMWRYAVRARLIRPDAADEEVQLLTKRLSPGLAGYLILIIAGIFLPITAVLGYLAIAVYFIIPFRRRRRRLLPVMRRRGP